MSDHGWPEWEWQVWVRDKAQCVYCRFNGCSGLREWWNLETDHLVPKSVLTLEGNLNVDHPENRVVACRTCNHVKLNFDPRKGKPMPPTPDKEWRMQMIESAKEYINAKMFGDKFKENFERMKLEIQSKDES